MIDQGVIMKIGIVGAGVSGIGAGRLLSQAGFDCEIFEQGSQVGGIWTEGYHTFGLQTPKSLYEVPDYPFPDSYPRLPSGEELQAYLENYAKDFNVFKKIQFHSSITRLERKHPSGWVMYYTHQETAEEVKKTFDYIVITTGIYFDPYMPEFPGQERFKGQVIHTKQYRAPKQVTGKKVVVLGFGKSALDVAGEVIKFAHEVTLVYRKAHWPIPMDILGFLDVRRIYLTRFVAQFLPLYQRPFKWTKLVHKYFKWLIYGFWRLTESIIKFQYSLKDCNVIADQVIEIDIFNLDFLPRKETFQLMRQGKIKTQKTSIKEFTENAVVLDNGESIECDVVILGTGYKANVQFLPESFQKSLEMDGVYLYRHILHPDLPDMAFVGRAATFSNSLTSHLSSVWLAHLLKGKFQLPETEEMFSEIESIKEWKRGFMPSIASRATVIKLHMIHFHDELLRDMSILPFRKKNLFLEWFGDYRPSDYRKVLSELDDS